MQNAKKDNKDNPGASAAPSEAPNEAHSVDLHVGQKLRQRRLIMGLTQEKLGKLLTLTFQQVQKYERGLNRVSASRLFEISTALKVPITYFFEDAPGLAPAPGMGDDTQEGLNTEVPADIDYNSRETAELLRAYYRVEDAKKRRRVLDLIRAMRDEKDDE